MNNKCQRSSITHYTLFSRSINNFLSICCFQRVRFFNKWHQRKFAGRIRLTCRDWRLQTTNRKCNQIFEGKMCQRDWKWCSLRGSLGEHMKLQFYQTQISNENLVFTTSNLASRPKWNNMHHKSYQLHVDLRWGWSSETYRKCRCSFQQILRSTRKSNSMRWRFYDVYRTVFERRRKSSESRFREHHKKFAGVHLPWERKSNCTWVKNNWMNKLCKK